MATRPHQLTTVLILIFQTYTVNVTTFSRCAMTKTVIKNNLKNVSEQTRIYFLIRTDSVIIKSSTIYIIDKPVSQNIR